MNTKLKISMVAVLAALGAVASGNDKVDIDYVRSADLRQERIASSPQFVDGKVVSHLPKVNAEEGMLKTMWKFFMQRDRLKPAERLQFQAVDTQLLAKPSKSLRVTWLGHSSLFVEVDNTRLLIDPVFDYAAPSFFFSLV